MRRLRICGSPAVRCSRKLSTAGLGCQVRLPTYNGERVAAAVRGRGGRAGPSREGSAHHKFRVDMTLVITVK